VECFLYPRFDSSQKKALGPELANYMMIVKGASADEIFHEPKRGDMSNVDASLGGYPALLLSYVDEEDSTSATVPTVRPRRSSVQLAMRPATYTRDVPLERHKLHRVYYPNRSNILGAKTSNLLGANMVPDPSFEPIAGVQFSFSSLYYAALLVTFVLTGVLFAFGIEKLSDCCYQMYKAKGRQQRRRITTKTKSKSKRGGGQEEERNNKKN